MKTSLAWHNLLHNKFKTGIAIAGVVFAIVLMFMQLGFLEAVKASATLIYNALDFDICIRSKDYLHLAAASNFPRSRLIQSAGIEGIQRAAPFTIANTSWRNRFTGERRAILSFGTAPEESVFLDPQTQSRVKQLLVRPDDLLIDTKTRREYGPQNGERFSAQDHGMFVEVNAYRMRIAGDFTCGAGLSSNGTAIMTEDGLQRVSRFPEGRISLGLVKITGTANLDQVVQELRKTLDSDVDVKSRQEVLSDELTYWVYETNYGLIFQTGVLLALVVGTAIVYQVLASDVSTMLPEYATLKAIGYGNRYLAAVVLQQAIALAFLLGLPISQILYFVTSAGAQIPMRMTGQNTALVFLLSFMMCVCSGVAALRKAFQADPADLF
jgi:putative ABC transport system permease protein